MHSSWKRPAEKVITPMKDNFGREIDYLRVSITTRCNLNCIYCGKTDCGKKEQELPAETFAALVRGFARCGIKKVRVTGGVHGATGAAWAVSRCAMAFPGACPRLNRAVELLSAFPWRCDGVSGLQDRRGGELGWA